MIEQITGMATNPAESFAAFGVFFIVAFFAILIIGFFVASLLLWFVTKILKFEKSSFGLAMLVTLISIVASFVVSFILGLLRIPFLGTGFDIFLSVLTFLTIIFIGILLIKEFYKESWGKSTIAYLIRFAIGIVLIFIFYIVLSIIGLIIGTSFYL